MSTPKKSKSESKAVWRSKTFWTNLSALVSMAMPSVREWLASNPVEFASALAAVNLLLRFVTKGAVTLFKDGGSARGAVRAVFIFGVVLTSLLTLSLTSCAQLGGLGLGGEVIYRTDDGAKAGLRSDGRRHTFFGLWPIRDRETGEVTDTVGGNVHIERGGSK